MPSGHKRNHCHNTLIINTVWKCYMVAIRVLRFIGDKSEDLSMCKTHCACQFGELVRTVWTAQL